MEVPATPVVPEAARASLNRLLAHPSLERAPRIREVLAFLVEELLNGRAEQVNEQRIAESVFRRSADFNTAEDNIVRVTLSHLRTRLEKYYDGEGRSEEWVLEIPRGKYVPVVHLRGAGEPSTSTPAALPPSKEGTRRTLYAIVAVLVMTNIYLAYRLLERPPDADQGAAQGLLAELFASRTSPVTVVVTDHNLWAARFIFGETMLLSEYVQRRSTTEPATPGDRARAYTRGRTSTSVTSAAVSAELQAALAPHGVKVRHPSEISTLDLQNDNVILLGSPWVNPWVQLFEDRLSFQVPRPEARGFEIHNTHPMDREPKTFVGHREDGVWVSYVRLAVMPNLSGSGHVVLIGGTGGDPPQDAGVKFLNSPESLAEVRQRFGASEVSRIPPFELILEVKGVERSSVGVRIVAQRRHSAEEQQSGVAMKKFKPAP